MTPNQIDTFNNMKNNEAAEKVSLKLSTVSYNDDSKYFTTVMGQAVFYRTYSKWVDVEQRRETWEETVTRASTFLRELSNNKLSEEDYTNIHNMILTQKIMPSMRLMATAGDAARRNNISLYNCAAAGISDLIYFKEAMIIIMHGTGFGYSVERKYVDKLPTVVESLMIVSQNFTIPDTAEGWAEALYLAITCAYTGVNIKFDYSLIRPAGTPLRTKGGTASGPEVLQKLLSNVTQIIRDAAGRKLHPYEVHSILCHVGEASVSGGHRRSALIAACDMDDVEMCIAKHLENYHYKGYGFDDNKNTHLSNANISVVFPFDRDITYDEFSTVWDSMINSGMGEPGFLNQRYVFYHPVDRREPRAFITNPCGEIQLDPIGQFCNLTSVIIRPEDTLDDLLLKVKYATIIGTIQSSATMFPGLRDFWQHTDERLLGVGLSGIQGNIILQLNSPNLILALSTLKAVAIQINAEYATILGIEPSVAITTVKPDGNNSVTNGVSPGISSWYDPFYIRRVEYNEHDSIFKTQLAAGVPAYLKQGQDDNVTTKWLIEYPIAAPKDAVVEGSMTAIQKVQHVMYVLKYYTEHNVSCSVYYRPDEVDALKSFVWVNLNSLNGITFFPVFEGVLPNLVYEKITEEEYNKRVASFPKIDFDQMTRFDRQSHIADESQQDLACRAGICDIL